MPAAGGGQVIEREAGVADEGHVDVGRAADLVGVDLYLDDRHAGGQ